MKNNQTPTQTNFSKCFTKQTIFIFLCFVSLTILATSCYTTNKCPAYGHYSQVIEKQVKTEIIN
jgi:hypothetical protein